MLIKKTRSWRAAGVSPRSVAFVYQRVSPTAYAVGSPVIVALLFLIPPIASAQQPDKGLLTLDRVFSGEFSSRSAGSVQWLKHSPGYTKTESSKTVNGYQDIVQYNPTNGERKVLISAGQLTPPGRTNPLRIEKYRWSPNEGLVLIFTNSQRVWRQNTRGDYWVYDVTSRKLHKLGGDAKPSTLMFAKFSPDSRKVAYVRDRNIFVEDLAAKKITQITERKSDTIINGTFDWVYEEELGLRDGIRWSPDSKMIAYWQLDTEGVGDYYLMNNTDGLYQKLKKFKYPKVGTTNAKCRVAITLVNGGYTYTIDLPGDPRNFYIARMEWITNTAELIIQQLNRLQNTNKLMIGPIPPQGVIRIPSHETILTERDKAWVELQENLHWLNGGKEFLWLSERDGWNHLYVATVDGGKLRLITPGDYDVMHIDGVDKKGGWVYFTASPDDATQAYLYRVSLDGKKKEMITPKNQRGTHSYNISPDAKWAIHTYSTYDNPPIAELISLPDHKVVKPLETNDRLKKKLAKLKRRPTEFVKIDIGDGVVLDGWLMKPYNFDPKKRYPILFYVYGEPAGQTVLDRWSGQRYLWHQMLAQQGYLVMSIDNRGTPAPRGRDWRKVVYRQVGILAPKEQAAAVKALLKKWKWIDPDRIGIWGWSGGGSMSLNAIFRYPDLYKTAMSIAPVANQRYYDTIYQERYMGLPQDNVKGFRDGSPITHAHRLKGNLLLVHGTADDNVHYANTEALVNELISHNKHFTMMAYPNRSHSIVEGRNTRRHLFGLLTRYLREHLPPDGK